MTQQTDFVNEFNARWDAGLDTFTLTTSGTTGSPKPWILHRSYLEWSANSTRSAWLQGLPLHQYCFLPTWKTAGFMQLVRSKVWQQPIEVFEPKTNPLLEVVPQGGITSLTPMQLSVILQDDFSLENLNRFDAVLIGGQALPQDLQFQLIQHCPNPKFIETFGSTETASHFAGRVVSFGNQGTNSFENSPERIGTLLTISASEEFFTATPGTKIKVNPFTGQLEVKNPTTQNQWLSTNDLVELVGTSSFRWIGRKDLIINTGGIKVQIEPLESQISLLTGWPIGSFYVVAKPDPVLGEKIVLHTLHNVDLGQLEFLFASLPPYHQPKEMYTVNRIPLTETGKIQRKTPVL
jgi:O-succinylbenzoic acid--CoA ligase